MSRAKAFWLGLGCTLAVLLPIYLAVAAVIFTRSAPADTVQSGVPIAQPTLGDEKNFLLMTGPEQPETFVLLRFDALEGNLCSVAIPGETVVLVNGRPATLADAAEQAGPAQAAAALMETLDIEIDNYLYCTADRLVDLAAGFGTARIPLANYMTPEALGQLQLNIPGVQTVSLTPQMLETCWLRARLRRTCRHCCARRGILPFCASAATRWQTQYRMPCARFWRRAPPT